MDRRTYRGNMRNNCDCNKNISPYKPIDTICDDIAGGYTQEDRCPREEYGGNIDRFPIGMCYVPWQCFRDLYENEFMALAHATIFKELDLEFCGRSCK